MKTKRRNVKVNKAVEENKWVDHVTPITTYQESVEFVALWEAIRGISLDSSREDTIRWRWTEDVGEYTIKSAYRIQFEGAFNKMRIMPIWKAKAEPKCRFFAWTLLHKKILTADNLSKRNWQHDPISKLCGIEHETPTHIWKDCPFTKEV